MCHLFFLHGVGALGRSGRVQGVRFPPRLRVLALVGDPGASRASHLPRLRPLEVIQSRPGRPHPARRAGSGGGDPARLGRPIPPQRRVLVVDDPARPGRPLPPLRAGAG